LVQDEDWLVCQNRPGYGQQLSLTLRHVGSIFVQLHVVPARECLDEVMRVSGFGSCDDLLICRIEPAVTDILHYSAFEKPRILQHHCKALSQFSAVEIPHI